MSKESKSYEIVFGKGVFARLYEEDVPKRYVDCIQRELERLKTDPTNLGVRCGHPYPGTKYFPFECLEDGHGFHFRAHFFFDLGETHIQVFEIAVAASW